MDTLLLDRSSWDLVLNVNGDIAVASDPYSLAQDAASECRTFQGEVYYDTTRGIPYGLILGQSPSAALIKARLQAAALNVPGVRSVEFFLTSVSSRVLAGQLQVTPEMPTPTPVAFNLALLPLPPAPPTPVEPLDFLPFIPGLG